MKDLRNAISINYITTGSAVDAHKNVLKPLGKPNDNLQLTSVVTTDHTCQYHHYCCASSKINSCSLCDPVIYCII